MRARLRSQRGDTLIEVLIAALMVALIASASLGAFGGIGKISETQRNEAEATALAQQDQARLRGLTISQLSSTGTSATFGNTVSYQTIDGTNYKVTSTASFISGSGGAAACSSSGTGGTADVVQTTSTVQWGTVANGYSSNGRNPVIVHGLITPNEGGSLVALVEGPGALDNTAGSGVSGVTISLSGGPTSVTPLTTDANGCAVFAGLGTGTYTVTYTPPTGATWILTNGSTTIPTQNVNVTATQTADAPTLVIGQAGSILATFQTTVGTSTIPATADEFMLASSGGITTPQTFGSDSTPTTNNYASSISTPSSPGTLFPYPSGYATDYYTAWTGGCASDEPSPAPAGFAINANTVTPVTITEPSMILQPYTRASSGVAFNLDDTDSSFSYSGGWTARTAQSGDYLSTEHTTTTRNATVTISLPDGTTTFSLLVTEGSGYGSANIKLNGGSNTRYSWSNGTTRRQYAIYSGVGTGGSGQTLTLSVTTSNKTVSVDEVTGTQINLGSVGQMTTQPNVIVTDNGTGCGSNKDYPPEASDPATNVIGGQWGALVNPGMPAGTYSVCVDNGVDHATITWNSATMDNVPQEVDIYSGGTHGTYGLGVCT